MHYPYIYTVNVAAFKMENIFFAHGKFFKYFHGIYVVNRMKHAQKFRWICTYVRA